MMPILYQELTEVRRQELLREAAHQALVASVTVRTHKLTLYRSLLRQVGRQMVAMGERLQAREATMPTLQLER